MDGTSPLSLTVREAVRRVRLHNPELNALVHTRLEDALADDRARADEPRRSPLHGVPYTLKDMWDTRGLPTTGGSWRFRDRVPETSSPVHEVFEHAGAVLLGKTNLSDLAIVAESDNYLIGATRNPHDPTRTSGGSSGGAAAAVAAGLTSFDWGTDFGGSIRLPAAWCGVFGLRLSTETWPVMGTFPVIPDAVRFMNGQGPLARDLATMRVVLDVARPRLRTGPDRPFRLRGATLWIPDGRPAGGWPSFAVEVAPALRRAAGELHDARDLPSVRRAHRASLAMWCAHFMDIAHADPTMSLPGGIAATLSGLLLRGRFGDRRMHPHTAGILAQVAVGRLLLYRDRPAALAGAHALRDALAREWDLGRVVVLPTTGFPAPRHGETVGNPWVAALTMPGNIIDATALAVPFGKFPGGLPRSIQLMGPPGSEDALIEMASRL